MTTLTPLPSPVRRTLVPDTSEPNLAVRLNAFDSLYDSQVPSLCVDTIDALTRHAEDGPARLLVDDHVAGRSGIEEVILELHHAPLSLRSSVWAVSRVAGERTTPAEIAEHARSVERRLREWHERELPPVIPSIVLGTIALRRTPLTIEPLMARFAVAVDSQGGREPLAAAVAAHDDPGAWSEILGGLKHRGTRAVGCFAVAPERRLLDVVSSSFPEAVVQLQLEPVLDELRWLVAPVHLPATTEEVRNIHKKPDTARSPERVRRLVEKPGLAVSPEHVEPLRHLLLGSLAYVGLAPAFPRHLRSDRLVREVRRAFNRHTCAICPPGDRGLTELLLVARLRWLAKTSWNTRRSRS
ncbi:hypothetical protein ASA1KI_37840 [Opitutales bacterium ASA1]|uniref:transposase n=1 Tax=Congregicoccus parvus TaxID=3081749 RepID=UPI002B30C1B0|nr:hypothetical protein ASA1KI_37840 [Opitutales bacterium ASA1]